MNGFPSPPAGRREIGSVARWEGGPSTQLNIDWTSKVRYTRIPGLDGASDVGLFFAKNK